MWSFFEQVLRKNISFITTIVLARFLLPEDFGLIAMMTVFLEIGTSLMDSGFKEALIRFEGAKQIDFNTAFYANLVLGLLSYILLFSCAPYIAQFYDELRLTMLIRVAGIAILINSFQVVQGAILSRNLNFKVQLQATVPAVIISGVLATGMAIMRYGVWALIAQMIVSALLMTTFLWKLQGWRPSYSFSLKSLSTMYNFGYKIFLSWLLYIIFNNIYVILIAKFFVTSIAGLYFFADKIKNTILNQIVGSIERVTYPALANMQHDNIRLKSGYQKIFQVTTFFVFPVMLLIAVFAQQAFQILLSEEWSEAVIFLQLMCIAGMLRPLNVINLNVLKVKGRSDLFLALEIYDKIIIITILFFSFKYGIKGILVGQIIATILVYIPICYFSFKLISYSVREQMLDLIPNLSLSVFVAIFVWGAGFISPWPAFVELIVLCPIFGLLYFLGAYLLKLQAFFLSMSLLKERMGLK